MEFVFPSKMFSVGAPSVPNASLRLNNWLLAEIKKPDIVFIWNARCRETKAILMKAKTHEEGIFVTARKNVFGDANYSHFGLSL
jgi:hypothetical protein